MTSTGYIEDGIHWRTPTAEEMEWYRLWFEFLKESDLLAWSEEVMNDFGDVHSTTFKKWWPEHRHLFRQPQPLTLIEIETEEDFHLTNDEGFVTVAVCLYPSKDDLRKAFDELLERHHPGGAGRRKFDHWGDVYALSANPDTNMLTKILAVYRAYQANEKKPTNKKMTLWELEEEISKATPLILKVGKKAEPLWQEQIDSGSKKDLNERRRKSQASTVLRYVRFAEEILRNVAVGDFPIYEKSKRKTIKLPPPWHFSK